MLENQVKDNFSETALRLGNRLGNIICTTNLTITCPSCKVETEFSGDEDEARSTSISCNCLTAGFFCDADILIISAREICDFATHNTKNNHSGQCFDSLGTAKFLNATISIKRRPMVGDDDKDDVLDALPLYDNKKLFFAQFSFANFIAFSNCFVHRSRPLLDEAFKLMIDSPLFNTKRVSSLASTPVELDGVWRLDLCNRTGCLYMDKVKSACLVRRNSSGLSIGSSGVVSRNRSLNRRPEYKVRNSSNDKEMAELFAYIHGSMHEGTLLLPISRSGCRHANQRWASGRRRRICMATERHRKKEVWARTVALDPRPSQGVVLTSLSDSFFITKERPAQQTVVSITYDVHNEDQEGKEWTVWLPSCVVYYQIFPHANENGLFRRPMHYIINR
uniref:Uncharacterized protein n=1 Tax=Romanomermis culicivorax TaxID=13658 RepID=A0A915KMF7_ROMCU